MAIAEKEIALIKKLNNHNYSNWSFKLENLLTRDNLFKLICDDTPATPDAEWDKNNAKARATIDMFIEGSQIIHVKHLKSAKLIWQALKSVHQRSNLSSKLFLLRKLYSQKLNEGGDMHAHINTILTLKDKLFAIGGEIKDSHIVALLLCSLPRSYDTLITALEARPENDLSLEFVKNKLTYEHSHRCENRNVSSNSREATYKVIKKKKHKAIARIAKETIMICLNVTT